MGLPAAVALFRTAASRTMRVTTGIACVTTRMRIPRMKTMVTMASSQSGAAFPLIVTLRSSRITGCPRRETTNATMTYTRTFLKNQHNHARIAMVPAAMR